MGIDRISRFRPLLQNQHMRVILFRCIICVHMIKGNDELMEEQSPTDEAIISQAGKMLINYWIYRRIHDPLMTTEEEVMLDKLCRILRVYR